MKNIFYGLILCAAVLSAQTNGLFPVITSTIPYSISDIQFISSTKGWIVGNSGMIMKSTDAGNSWTAVNSGVTNNLQKIHFVNDQVGYAGFTGKSSILRTSNGGTSWQVVNLPVSPSTDTARTPYAIYFLSPSTGFVGCGKSAASDIFMTTDSGKTWTSKLNLVSQSAYFTDIAFSGPNRGVAVANNYAQLYYTSNGGSTWTKSAPLSVGTVTYTSSVINAVSMTDSLHVNICGWGSWFSLQPMMLFSSVDGGASYTFKTLNGASNAYGSGYDQYFKDKMNGLAVGGYRGCLIVKTTDGGSTWTQLPVLSGHQLRAITGSGDTVWATSLNGLIVRSTDMGTSWKSLTNNTQEQIESAQFISQSVGYLTTYYGGMRKTTDGGTHWSNIGNINPGIPGNALDNVQAVKFVDANLGFAAHNYGEVSRTTNGGTTWSIVVPGDSSTNSAARAIFPVSANKVYVVRTKATTSTDQLITLTNSGASYTIRDTVMKKQPNDIAFYDDYRGIVVGSSGGIKYTVNGGTSWGDGSVTGIPAGKTLSGSSIYMVQIIDSVNTWAVGTSLLLKSTDLGKNWTYVPHNIIVPDTILYSMKFLNKNIGYVGGLRGGLSKTTNGGTTWTQIQGIDIANAIWEIAFKPDSSAWICTSIGNVFTNATLANVAAVTSAPKEFTLDQNYPNPFNPSTTISYSIAAKGTVFLRIYNVLGQHVVTIVNGMQDAGEHSVQFDAHSLSSGVYFYTLTSSGLTVSKRMILMK